MTEHAKLVREFTEQSKGIKCPESPIFLDTTACKFIVRMILSELAELYQTVYGDIDRKNVIDLMIEHISNIDTNDGTLVDNKHYANKQIAAFDNIIDIIFNVGDHHEFDLDSLFNVVHAANMAKRFPDGTFHRRDDGKVIKPDGWQEADVTAEARSWYTKNNKPKALNKENVISFTCAIAEHVNILYDPSDAVIEIDFTQRDIKYEDEAKLVGDQADALIDMYYYILDTAAKHGITLPVPYTAPVSVKTTR